MMIKESLIYHETAVFEIWGTEDYMCLVQADKFSRFRKASLNRSTVLSSFLTY